MPKDYEIARSAGTCASCGRQLAAGEEFMAVLKETPDQLAREDYCVGCWSAEGTEAPAAGALGTWKTRLPQPREKKRLFVDDDLLVNFLDRLADADAPAKVAFRYVLALVLMRKKLLVYDRTETLDDGAEVWQMHLKGDGREYSVIDPKLDEDGIAGVSRQLGEILEGEL
jgi:hypothetical protein